MWDASHYFVVLSTFLDNHKILANRNISFISFMYLNSCMCLRVSIEHFNRLFQNGYFYNVSCITHNFRDA